MANFLITTPNSLTQGTDTTDLFVLTTALGASVFAAGGADQISANATNFVNADFEGGQGNDSIFLTAGGAKILAATRIRAGAGNDIIAIDAATTNNSTIIGGGGNDTIQLIGGVYTDVQINGNLGSDLITASGTNFLRTLIGGGGDNDTINLAASDFLSATINGGGGADLLTFTNSTLSGVRVEGDLVGDSQFFGNDTIRFNSGTVTSSIIQGGGGADQIIVSAVIGSGVSIEGNQGADSIFLDAFIANGATFLGGGAGNDTIAVSGALAANFGTIQGGGGLDVINVSAFAGNGGFIMGGADADQIGLGTIASGAVIDGDNASGVNVNYASFADSNLAGFDTISARAAGEGTGGYAFMITQSAVNFRVAAFDRAGVVSGNATGFATFTGTFAGDLTARAAALDLALVQGQAVIFQNGAGTNFLFVQGGATGAGGADDLVVQLNVNMAAGTGGIFRVNGSALKVVFD